MIAKAALFGVTAAAIGLGVFGTLIYRLAVELENRPNPLGGGWANE